MKIILCWKNVQNGQERLFNMFLAFTPKIFFTLSLKIMFRYLMLCWDGSQQKTDCFILCAFCLSIASTFTRKSLTLYVIFKSLRICWYFIRIRTQRTQSEKNHGQLKKYGRTQRTFFMERGREELLVDQCCKYCHFWQVVKIAHLNLMIWKIIKFVKTIRHNIL